MAGYKCWQVHWFQMCIFMSKEIHLKCVILHPRAGPEVSWANNSVMTESLLILSIFKIVKTGLERWLRAHITLVKDQFHFQHPCQAVQNHRYLQLQGIQCPALDAWGHYTYIHKPILRCTYAYNLIFLISKKNILKIVRLLIVPVPWLKLTYNFSTLGWWHKSLW